MTLPACPFVAFGGSSGGQAVVSQILPALPVSLLYAVVIVQHTHPQMSLAYTLSQLRGLTALPIVEVTDKLPPEPGHIYVAPPNYHLHLEATGVFALSVDPPVHYARPSIDVFFESASYALGPRLIAVVLSGANCDGAEGAALVKRRGGRLIVQDPGDAACPSMPQAVIDRVAPDAILTAAQLAAGTIYALETCHDL